MSKIIVFAPNKGALEELISGAYSLNQEKPLAIVAGDAELANAAAQFGADVALIASGSEKVEEYVESIAAVIAAEQPAAVMFDNSLESRAVAGRVAAKFGCSVQADAKSVSPDFTTTHLIYGGAAIKTMKPAKDMAFIMTTPNTFPAAPIGDAGSIKEAEFIAPKWTIKVTETRTKEAQSVQLASAKKVVAVGLGLAKEEDLAMIYELADLLGAEVGCTRPLVEGMGWMEHERYIGLSNVFIKPDLYIAIGISGQVHHTVGVTDSKTIVAINKNKDCPMMKQSDYYIADDLYKVVPLLIEKLKERKQ